MEEEKVIKKVILVYDDGSEEDGGSGLWVTQNTAPCGEVNMSYNAVQLTKEQFWETIQRAFVGLRTFLKNIQGE
jgi:hypothetical protein